MTFLHATWALLNLTLIVGAFVVGYRSYRIFSGRFGYLPGGLLILAIAGTCSGSRSKMAEPPISTSYIKNMYPGDTWPYRNHNVSVYGDDLFRITQSISITPVQNTDSLRLQSTVTASGLTVGTRWESAQTVAGLLPGRQAFYQSTGTLTWYLLGVPLYNQWKRFDGGVSLDEL